VARLLYRLGRLVAAHPVIVLLLWIAFAVGITLAVKQVGSETNNNVDLPGTGSQLATDLLQAGFPPQQNGSNPIIFKVSKGKVTDSANKQAITDSYKAIKKIKFVHTATSPFSQDGSGQISKDKKIAFISVLLSISSNELTEEQAQRVMDAAQPGVKAGMDVEGGGSIGSTLSPNDTGTSDLIGILAAMLILTLTFGTVVAMGMPIGGAIIGLTTALGLIGLLGHVMAVPDIAHTVATMIGLAVGIDYALFLVTRHRSQLADGMELHESIARAVGTAGTAIVFAGTTVVVALVSLVVAGIPLVSSLGYTGAMAVATAVLAAITLLPAFMSLAGPKINSIALPQRFQASDDPAHKGLWGRWAGFVVHRPYVPMILAFAILIPLIIPVFTLHLGQEDIGQTPTSTMQRRAYDLMQQGFGPGYNGPLIIAVALTPAAKANPTVTSQENQLKKLQNELDKEQKQGKQMQAQLESGQASLQKQQTQLEKQQAELESQQAQLNAEAASLAQQQATLEAQGAALQQEQDQLVAQATALEARVKELARLLILNRAQQKRVEHAISISVNPARIARLEAKLARLKREEAAMVKEAKADVKEAKALRAKEATIQAENAQLTNEKNALLAQKADLEQQAAVLQQQGDALQQQGNELQQQGAALQEQQQQLEALQKKADKQQKQANKLHNELVKTLTKAGGDDRGTDPRLVKLQDALTNTKGDKLVSPPQISKKGNDTVFTVIATTAPSSQATVDLVGKLRDTVIPNATGKGIVAFVGGSTASNVDLAAEISKRLSLVIITILLLSMVVLMVAFRSLLIPLQAAATNLLTALAAFGILTVCFQWGWGIGLTGVETSANSVPIASYVPLMMFAILFGLSMDYQVFLLSSVDHHRAEGEDDRASVGAGLRTAARVIAAAALIMVSVFGSFILNGDPVVKQFGVGLASAVFLAATMVLMLAPSVLILLGKWAWWMPRWLGKIIPAIDIEGTNLGKPKQPPPEPPSEMPPDLPATEPDPAPVG
jgi:uncharacterized membrane protein YdfJ with MMPL/SSD domain